MHILIAYGAVPKDCGPSLPQIIRDSTNCTEITMGLIRCKGDNI